MEFVDTMITTKAALVAAMKKQLMKDSVACRALMRIYENQTSTEQVTRSVRNNNGVGFMHSDAIILSSFAEQYKDHGTLSEKQMEILKNKIVKYAGQLINGSICSGKLVKQGKTYFKAVG